MVGLKTFWILISTLFLVVACVPQSKQTSCGANQAFNASLRQCVPVVGGPSSYVSISNYSPASAITKSKGDFSNIPLEITVQNPYDQATTIVWERVFNGTPVTLTTCNDSKTCNVLRGYDLGTALSQIGIHIVTAKVKVGSDVVASHSFEVKINDYPKPSINTGSILPSSSVFNLTYTPLAGAQIFSFPIKNNTSLDNLANWRTTWTVTRDGVLIPSLGESDVFTNFGSTQTNSSELGTSSVASFNPSVLGVGNYTIRAIVQNDSPGEVVDEKLWTITVKHPDFGVIQSATLPLPSVTTVAFHNVDYSSYGFFDPNDVSRTKASYCVSVNQPQGSYIDGSSADSTVPYKNVLVRFYKDNPSSTPIFEGKTSAGDGTICFSDASVAQQAQLFFSDGSATTSYNKKLLARVFDEQTGNEFCQATSPCSLVSYPVTWNITVKPMNTPPVASILATQAGDNLSYQSSGSTTRNATVAQDSTFRIRFRITDDALEWTPATNTNKFAFSATLKRGSTTVDTTSCLKDFATATVGPDYVCTFSTILSSDGSGPITAPQAHTLTLTAEDLDSPTPGSSGTTSNMLTWNLTVTESQTAPIISATNVLVGGAPIDSTLTEKSTITFQVAVADTQKDKYSMTIVKCADSSCAAAGRTNFTGNTSAQSYGVPAYSNNTQISYYIPENAVGNNLSGTIYFYVTLTDIPDTVTGSPATFSAPATQIIPVFVNNWNAKPVITPASLTAPAPNLLASPFNVLSGYRFTISSVGAVSDASVAGSGENTIQYQWWISPQASTAWTKIDGATSDTLRWTPGPELTATQVIKFCVSDGSVTSPSINSDPSVASTICSPDYFISPKPNLSRLTDISGTPNGTVAIHHVPSERLAYVAYASGTTIYVEKFTYNTDGTLNTSGMRVASFAAVSTSSTVVKNLSLAASSTSLFVAYLADDTLTPGSFKARVRRVNISNTEAKSATAFAASTRKFDFNYSAISVSNNCSGAGNCVYDTTGRTLTFSDNPLNGGEAVQITVSPFTPVSITASVASPTPAGSICANCIDDDKATTFADAFNASNDTKIQGLTASVSGNVVTFRGMEANSFYDHTDTTSAVGKIIYNSTLNRWYLPIVNPGLTGSDQNKIQMLSDLDDGDFNSVVTTNIFSNLDTATFVDNAVVSGASGTMVLGYITQSGVAKVANIPLSGTTYDSTSASPLTIFSGANMQSIKVKASPGSFNPYIFVVAKDVAGEFRIARLPANLGAAGDQIKAVAIADSLYPTNASILDPAQVVDMDVQPALLQGTEISTSEARLAVVSRYTGSAKTYLFRWKKILTSPFDSLNCSEGQDVDKDSETMTATTSIATAPIVNTNIGSAGGVANEHYKNILPLVRINSATGGTAEVGLMNSQIEGIDSTTRSAAGRYRPALFK